MEKKLSSEIESNKILSASNESLKKEKEYLISALSKREETIQELQLSIQTAQQHLFNERMKSDDMNKERTFLKGNFFTGNSNLVARPIISF